MLTNRELKQAVMKLPLPERQDLLEIIERSISDEIDRIAAASVANDIQTIEQHLAGPAFTAAQKRELRARVDAADRGEATYVPWNEVQQAVLMHLRRPK